MQVDRTLIRELAELLKETDLTEIEVADGDRRIRVARQISAHVAVSGAPVVAAAPVAAPIAAPVVEAVPAPADITKHPGLVASPMVGTCYLSPEPTAAPFVSVGSSVKEGETLLIIEAMKVMNAIPAPKSGVIKQILISNQQPVEYGEPLMVIE
jgi:acetyl-CoA carboxylase biotin carboxyl carrier protein